MMMNLPQMHHSDFFDLFPSVFDGNVNLLNGSQMNVDISETEENYQVKADLPGFNKEDIRVDFENGILTIKGQREKKADVKDDAGNFIRRERSSGSISRSFALQNVDASGVKADFVDGVLSIVLPKLENSDHTKIEIK
ncbi:Hsp20/alpha crystallin family protein [Listeria aquatica]|uniref:Hsp20/alpha crystallin family protein n=2 Tax=Listeria aquatica TaxID=1494960 RepID=A0A841ZPX5_9LIST|nr:Hsp20/alpha crystallin family protein [Listeria aquatica]